MTAPIPASGGDPATAAAQHQRHITLAILAGGAGRRMGCPKASLSVAGKPILAYLHENFAWQGPTLLVLSPAVAAAPASELFSTIALDAVADEGPLRGIFTAMGAAKTPLLAVATVDMPLVAAANLAWLVQAAASRPGCRGLFLQREGTGHVDPFPCIVHRDLASAAGQLLAAGHRAAHHLASLPGCLCVPPPPWFLPALDTNLNTPADLLAFQQRPSCPSPAAAGELPDARRAT